MLTFLQHQAELLEQVLQRQLEFERELVGQAAAPLHAAQDLSIQATGTFRRAGDLVSAASMIFRPATVGTHRCHSRHLLDRRPLLHRMQKSESRSRALGTFPLERVRARSLPDVWLPLRHGEVVVVSDPDPRPILLHARAGTVRAYDR